MQPLLLSPRTRIVRRTPDGLWPRERYAFCSASGVPWSAFRAPTSNGWQQPVSNVSSFDSTSWLTRLQVVLTYPAFLTPRPASTTPHDVSRNAGPVTLEIRIQPRRSPVQLADGFDERGSLYNNCSMAILRVKKGPLQGAEFPVFSTREPNVIGRDQSVEISLQDQRASRRHAAIVVDHRQWFVEDLDSSNGTLLDGTRVSRARLSDGMSLHVGSHRLSFHEFELAPPPTAEFYGTQLEDTLREEAGVLVCRGYQHAMDRYVRVDWLHPKRGRSDPSVLERLGQAIEGARSLPSDQLVPILRARVSPRIDDAPSSFAPNSGEAQVSTYVVLRGGLQPSLEAELGQILLLGAVERARLFRQLVERILERASHSLLAYPIGLAHIGVAAESGAVPELSIPALDLGAYLASETGDAYHVPGLGLYLAPECRGGPPDDGRRALTYNLGAMGCHLLTGRVPAGKDDVVRLLESHDPRALSIPSGLVSLLEQMLETDPERRPSAGGELLEEVRRVTAEVGSPPPTRSASRDDVLSELEDDPFFEEGQRDKPVPRAVLPTARPPRPSLTRRRRAKRSSGLLFLPLWILLWIGLFFAARHLARIAFRELGL